MRLKSFSVEGYKIFKDKFFFSDKIIVVEGDTEAIVLNYIKKHNNVNCHVIKARGKATIVTIMKILNQFDTEYYVLFDLDNADKKSSQTLEAELTKSLNIYKEKGKSKIFATNHTFEKVFYSKTVNNSDKTKAIIDILDNNKDREIKKDILSTFNMIFELGLPKKGDFAKTKPNSEIIVVQSESSIREKFDAEYLKEQSKQKITLCNFKSLLNKNDEKKHLAIKFLVDQYEYINNQDSFVELKMDIQELDLGKRSLSSLSKFIDGLFKHWEIRG